LPLSGKSLSAGSYRFAWELLVGTDRVEVRVLRGKELLYSAWAGVATVESAFPYDSIGYTRNGSGQLELAEIRFAESHNLITLKSATLAFKEQR